jgi:hypothetical protein
MATDVVYGCRLGIVCEVALRKALRRRVDVVVRRGLVGGRVEVVESCSNGTAGNK